MTLVLYTSLNKESTRYDKRTHTHTHKKRRQKCIQNKRFKLKNGSETYIDMKRCVKQINKQQNEKENKKPNHKMT